MENERPLCALTCKNFLIINKAVESFLPTFTLFLYMFGSGEKGRAKQNKKVFLFAVCVCVCLSFFSRFQCNEEYLFTHLIYIFVFAFIFFFFLHEHRHFTIFLKLKSFVFACLLTAFCFSFLLSFFSFLSLSKTNLFRTRIANLFSLLIFTLSYIDVRAENERKLKGNMNNGAKAYRTMNFSLSHFSLFPAASSFATL